MQRSILHRLLRKFWRDVLNRALKIGGQIFPFANFWGSEFEGHRRNVNGGIEKNCCNFLSKLCCKFVSGGGALLRTLFLSYSESEMREIRSF